MASTDEPLGPEADSATLHRRILELEQEVADLRARAELSERREEAELERRVAQRTSELRQRNALLESVVNNLQVAQRR